LFDEEWCLTWFAHYTFDIGQTDQETLNSFEEFVYRMKRYNSKNGKMEQFSDGTSYWNEPYCLMGAEDRWRWKGDPKIDDSRPPCRCKFCKEKGVITIGH